MKRLALFILACNLTRVASTAVSTPEQFTKAVNEIGSEYTKARDSLLLPDTDVDFIKGKLQSQSPNQRLVAQIIMGWMEHKDEYTRLARQTIDDRAGMKRYPWSYDPQALTASLLPLMYEFLLKEQGNPAATDAAVRVINYLARQNTTPDIKALIDVLRQDQTPEGTRAEIARTVSALPETLVPFDDLFALLLSEASRTSKSKDVASNLMNGMIRSGGGVADKDKVVDRLLGMDSLRALVGETAVVYTVAGIGGDRAASRVTEFFGQAQILSQKRWALSTLGTMENDKATDTLLNFAIRNDVDRPYRVYAIDSLSKTKYAPKIGKTLVDIINDEGKSERERIEAVKTLEKLYLHNLNSHTDEADIRQRVEKLDPAAVSSPRLRDEINKAKAMLKPPRPSEQRGVFPMGQGNP
jgi:hypothetical protein